MKAHYQLWAMIPTDFLIQQMGLMQGFFFELCNIFNSYAPDASAVVKSKSRKEYYRLPADFLDNSGQMFRRQTQLIRIKLHAAFRLIRLNLELCNIFNSYAPDASAVVKSKSRKEYIFERFYES